MIERERVGLNSSGGGYVEYLLIGDDEGEITDDEELLAEFRRAILAQGGTIHDGTGDSWVEVAGGGPSYVYAAGPAAAFVDRPRFDEQGVARAFSPAVNDAAPQVLIVMSIE